jgi:sec-independent protein translocase protein TatB
MFDIGFWEILLILVLALVVIGPERLPGAARKAGYFFGKARRYIEGVRSEVESELDVSEFKRMLHNQEVQINELKQQLQDGVDKVGRDVNQDVSRDVSKDIDKDLPGPDILTDVPTHSFYDTEQTSSSSQQAENPPGHSSGKSSAESSAASSGSAPASDAETDDDKPVSRRAE